MRLMFQFGILLIALLAYLDKKNNCLTLVSRSYFFKV
ncbi:putative holin-like toxin [Leuconostoc rapi]